MSEQVWSAVDDYIGSLVAPDDAALKASLDASREAGLPRIQVSPVEGKLLHVLARQPGVRRILEVGTLGGYSTIWMARALPPGGQVVTLEKNPDHARVARENFRRAGLDDRIELRLGAALDTLPQIEAEGRGPFDLIFLDADKSSLAEYFTWAVRLARRGSLILVDNVIRGGKVLDAGSTDPEIQGVRRFHALLASEGRVTATVIQTVGKKGHDGLALALVTEVPR